MTPRAPLSSTGAHALVQEDRALLLRRTPYGESSLVVHLLCQHHGRVELIAKGAHRPKSRFSGVLDWFDTLELDWSSPPVPAKRAQGSSRTSEWTRLKGLSPLRSGDIDRRRRHITGSLATYRAAHTALELTELATRAGEAEEEFFPLIERTLNELNALGQACAGQEHEEAGPGVIPATLARFELRLLRVLGVEPALLACAACGEAAPPVVPLSDPPRAPFAPRAGGRLCPTHAEEAHAAGLRVGTLPIDVLEGAHGLLNARTASGLTSDPLVQRPPSREFSERVLDFAGRFLDHQLETRPKSHAEFLGAPDRNRRQRRGAH